MLFLPHITGCCSQWNHNSSKLCQNTRCLFWYHRSQHRDGTVKCAKHVLSKLWPPAQLVSIQMFSTNFYLYPSQNMTMQTWWSGNLALEICFLKCNVFWNKKSHPDYLYTCNVCFYLGMYHMHWWLHFWWLHFYVTINGMLLSRLQVC